MKSTLILTLSVACLAVWLPAQNSGVTGDNQINKCEAKTYTISIENNSGSPLTELVVANDIGLLTGFAYVPGSSSLQVGANPPFCSTDPAGTTTLTWDIDALCPPGLTLADGETLSISFQLQTGCDAVSGSMNVHFTYEIGGTPSADDTSFSIQVLPGGVTIKKTPAVIAQEVGQNVTWTIAVENTGLGAIQNVRVTDVIGSGLLFVSSSRTCTHAAQTTTWDWNQVPEFVSMDPGDIVSFTITCQVVACTGLESSADVRWGCDAVTDCFNTADDGGTATASVERIVKTPNTSFTPPDVTFTYCTDTSIHSMTVTNVGDGTAHDVQIDVDFGSLAVVAVTPPATYDAVNRRFEIGDIAAGDHVDLQFTLQYTSWCSGASIARTLTWIPHYLDDCGNDFYPPVEVSQVNAVAGSATLSVTKSGAATAIQIGGTVTYAITSAYTGPLSCGSGSVSAITVVDTVPDGFTVIDAGGGTYVPGGGGTGGTITWAYTPPASLDTSIVLQAPDRSQCETYCFTTFTNSVSASGTDCCGCPLTASASQTTAIECEELVDSEKTANPVTQERCETVEYTNTYDFGAAGVSLHTLLFEEHAENQQQFVPGSLSVTYDGADITGCVVVTDTTPGGNLSLDFSGCAADLVDGKNLTITYRLRITEATVAACNGASFYSWSSLTLNTTGAECLQDGIIRETTVVAVQPPAMSVAISGLPRIVDKCQTQTLTITLAQTSTVANPRDVRLVLSGLNYYVVAPAATVCGGTVSPTSCTPAIVGDDYVWTFADGFTGVGQNATLELSVQKRCTGSGDLVATAYFDDLCNDDGSYDDTCSASATVAPAMLLSGDLLIEKNPEVYYAASNTVAWKIYVTNRGTGTAYNVWVDDVLGAGLDFLSATVDDMTGVTVTADQDHGGAAINGATISISNMLAGERREIAFTATLLDCSALTNDVTANWGCVAVDCQAAVSDHSTVEIPAPLLVNTNVVVTPIDACTSPAGSVTLRNAGQTTCYNLQITETLPAGLGYVPGSTRWRLNGGGWNGPNAAYDPNPTTSPIVWRSAQIPALASIDPGDTIEIEFSLAASCPFAGGTVTVSTQYENPCGQVFTNADSAFAVALRAPVLNVTKTRASNPVGCGELVEWTITVENAGTYTLPFVWVEDTMDAAYTYTSSVGDPPFTSDNGTFDGVNKVAWELQDVHAGDTVTLTLRATTDSSPCSPDLDNTVQAWWGCGASDGSSATKPGVNPPDNNLCLTSTSSSDVRTETREPTVGILNVALDPASINSCDDSSELTVTVSNAGVTDASDLDLVITLPAGLTYNAGTSAACVGADGTCATIPVGDPTIVGNELRYYDIADKGSDLADVLQADGGTDTLVLKFSVQSACYVTADLGFRVTYYDCCGDTQYSATSSETLTALFPDLAITKTPVNSQVDCAQPQTWTITVTNNGSGQAEVVRVEDTPGAWIDVRTGQPGDPVALGGGRFGWEFNNLLAGASQSFTLVGTLNPDGLPNQADCTASLRQNNVRAIWGCGTAGDATDGDPTTTSYTCTSATWANAAAATLRMPDLIVTAITPLVSCTADGAVSGTVSVTVQNQGSGVAYGGFTVNVNDGQGWSGSGSTGADLAAGASTTIVIDVSSWAPACATCDYSFTASVDAGAAVCECNEANNGFGPQAYAPAIPNLQVSTDTLAISCVADGQYRVSGTITLRNAGCSGTLTQDVPVRFTLFSGTGCSGAQVAQWSQTFSGVSITAGAAQAFTITDYTITGNAVTSATACQFSILTEADPTNTICECDGSDNSLCSDKTFTIPDLRVDSDTLAITCNNDAQIRIQGNIVVANDGCGGDFTTNIPVRIRVYNNSAACSGTNGTLTLTLTGVTIPAGGTQTFTINQTMNRNLCVSSTGCQVRIGAELDYGAAICESDGGDNNYCSEAKTVSIPDLTPTADTIAVACLQDGQVRVSGTVTIANNGCNAAVTGNVPVRFTLFSNPACGGVQIAQWTETFAGAAIAAGASQVFTLTDRDVTANICTNSTGCQVSVRIEVDNGVICECNGGNNSLCSSKSVSVPDLRITAVTPSIACTGDGATSGSVQVTVNNNGCGTATGIPVRLASDCGYSFSDQTVASLAAGASTTLTFAFTPDIARCACVFTATADPDNLVCECDGTNNSLAAASFTPAIADLVIDDIDFSGLACASDSISGSVAVTVRNQGCGTAGNFQVSLATDGCLSFSNQAVVSLAAGASTTLTFTVTGSWADCTVQDCAFTATADATGGVCEFDGGNNSRTETHSSPLPHLTAASVVPSASCTADGTLLGTIAVAVTNAGAAPVNSDFSILVDDGQGWTSELRFNADLGGTLPLAPGASQTVAFAWTRAFTAAPYTCSFPAVTATVDSRNDLCECSSAGHQASAAYALPTPDLRVVSITPSCSADGSYSLAVVVANEGCGAAGAFSLQLADNDGRSATQAVAGLASGAQTTVTFSPWTVDGSPASLDFTATVDPAAAVCELDGTNNVLTLNTVTRPNLRLVSLTPSCLGDSNYQVAMVVENNGSAAVSDDFHVALSDNDGHSREALFTSVGGTLPFAAGTQQTITFSAWTVDCNPTTIVFSATLDSQTEICESNDGDNADTAQIVVDNLAASQVLASVSCTADGTLLGTIAVTVTNAGGRAVSGDFSILVDDGQGWTSELRYNADLGGTLPIAAGSSSTVTFAWTRAFTAAPYTCSFPAVTATVDSRNDLCECTTADNGASAAYTLPVPNLTVTAVATGVVCNADGALAGTTVTIANNGCADATGVQVRLSSDCGLTFADQFVDLPAGSTRDVVFPFSSGIVNCTCNFTAVVDPDAAVCELEGGDNSRSNAAPMSVPDIRIADDRLAVSCAGDGQLLVSGSVSLENAGCGPALTAPVPMRFTLYGGSGCGGDVLAQWTETFRSVSIAPGGRQTFPIAPRRVDADLGALATGCRVSIGVEADYSHSICEWDGSNNTACAANLAVDVPDLHVSGDTLALLCPAAGQAVVTGSLTLRNGGCGTAAAAVPVRFTLYAGSGCGGTPLAQWRETLAAGTLVAGASRELAITPRLVSIDLCASPSCLYSLRSEIDPDAALCESNGGNNDRCTDLRGPCRDVLLSDLQSACLPDGTVVLTITVRNDGAAPAGAVAVTVRDEGGAALFGDSIQLAGGETRTLTAAIPGLARGQSHALRVHIDESGAVPCDCDRGDNERSITVTCPGGSEGTALQLSKSCGTASGPGGLFRFTITVVNSGQTDLVGLLVEDDLPERFRYVTGSATLSGQPLADPPSTNPLTWLLGNLAAGERVTLTFAATTEADIDPARYCNEARASARTAPAFAPAGVDARASCCTVVARTTTAGCCLHVEQEAVGAYALPEAARAVIDPYFETGPSMFAAWAMLNLWQANPPAEDTFAGLMRARLAQYALSTVEEFYLRSGLGHRLADGSIWLSVAGALPEEAGSGWRGQQVDRFMTAAQLGYELLGLDAALRAEERPGTRRQLTAIVQRKITFVTAALGDLPHAWTLTPAGRQPEQATPVREKADRLDRSALALGLGELAGNGRLAPADRDRAARAAARLLAGGMSTGSRASEPARERRGLLLHSLALLHSGQRDAAAQVFGQALKPTPGGEETELAATGALADVGLAVYLGRRLGSDLLPGLERSLHDRFYLDDASVYAEKQPDFTYDLREYAPLLLALDQEEDASRQRSAITLYRLFDEMGLFLKKRNLTLEGGAPLFLPLGNYRFANPDQPVLTSIRARREIAPVLARSARLYLPRAGSTGELAADNPPLTVSPSAPQNRLPAIAALAATLQRLGDRLLSSPRRLLAQEGLTLRQTGQAYVEALLASGAGLSDDDGLLLPGERLAWRGPGTTPDTLEAYDSTSIFSSAALADWMTAETAYLAGGGRQKPAVERLLRRQAEMVHQFTVLGRVPARFGCLEGSGPAPRLLAIGPEEADGITLAKLLAACEDPADRVFLEAELRRRRTDIGARDLLFLATAPQLAPLLRTDLERFLAGVDVPQTADRSARLIALGLLSSPAPELEPARRRLSDLWDAPVQLPRPDAVRGREGERQLTFTPESLALWLAATTPRAGFAYERTLSFLTGLLDSSWGVLWNRGAIGLPPAQAELIHGQPRLQAEPGDRVRYRVRVRNLCEGTSGGMNLPAVYLRSIFDPPLNWLGSSLTAGLEPLGDGRWLLGDLTLGATAEFYYDIWVPFGLPAGAISTVLSGGSRAGFEEFGPDSAAGDACLSVDGARRLPFLPLHQLTGLVFADQDGNGTRETGEDGLANIRFRDSRGRVFRSDAEGRFAIPAGSGTLAVQLDLQSLPAGYLLPSTPTRLVNRESPPLVFFPLLPSRTLRGFVYRDGNGNGRPDEGEERPAGVRLQAGDKAAFSGADGRFEMRNLPRLWQERLRVSGDQPLYDGDPGGLKVAVGE